jgi:predicted permease
MTLPRLLIRAAALLVPRGRRADWLEEWEAELWALASEQPARPGFDSLRFVMGAPWHAAAERFDDWTIGGSARDLRDAIRRLTRAPALTLTCVLILGLATAANTAIFSVVNATFFRTPPGIAGAEELVQLGREKNDGALDNLSYPAFAFIREQAPVFESLAAFSHEQFVLDAGTSARYAAGSRVSSGYFRLLGATLSRGREISPSEERAGDPVAIVSHTLWQRRFASAGDGATIAVNGRMVTIIGVASPGFVGTEIGGAAPELWLPVSFDGGEARLQEVRLSWLSVVGRLRRGVTIAQAQAAMTPVNASLEAANPHSMTARLLVVPGIGLSPQDRVEAVRVSTLLMGSVVLVLLIACVNVAGLLVARTADRRREVAVRLALGATRFRIARESLTESLLIAVCGGGLALAAGIWVTAGVRRLLPYEFAVGVEPDLRVFAFTFGGALACGLLLGAMPASRTARTSLITAIREGATTREAARLRSGLVVAQVVLSFVLMSGTVMLVRSLANIHRASPGYELDRALAVSVNLDLAGWSEGRAALFMAAAAPRLGAVGGVESVGITRRLPVADPPARRSVTAGDGSIGEFPLVAVTSIVDDGFFRTLRLPITAGRGILASDDADSGSVAVVSESLARRLWPGGDALGRQLRVGPDTVRTVGVAGPARLVSLRDADTPAVYLPLRQHHTGAVTLLIRAADGVDPRRLAAPARAIVSELAAGVPIERVETLRHLVAGSLGETRLAATLLSIYGAATLLLAGAGVYGVLSFSIRQRTREIGVRLALGANPAAVRRGVVRQALGLVLLGIVPGSIGAAVAGRALNRLLFGTTPTDPLSLGAVAVLFAAMAVIAAWIPARHAASVDPIQSLRID